MIAVAIGFLAAFVQGGVSNQPSEEDFVLTEKNAYLLLPPVAVGSGQASMIGWSPTGRYLLVSQSSPTMTPSLIKGALQGSPPPEISQTLLWWDKETSRTISLGSLKGLTPFSPLQWLAGSNVAIGIYDEAIPSAKEDDSRLRVVLVVADLGTGQFRRTTLGEWNEPEGYFKLDFSPTLPKALISYIYAPMKKNAAGVRPESRVTLWTIDANLRQSSRVDAGPGALVQVMWHEGGQVAKLSLARFEERERKDRTVDFDLRTNQMLPQSAGSRPYRPSEVEAPLRVTITPSQTTAGTITRRHPAAWIESVKPTEQSVALLSPKSQTAALSPTNDAVAYEQDGIVMVRQLVVVPKELFFQARDTARKAIVMNQAKQVGLALLIFAADNDDKLPGPEQMPDCLKQYLQNEALMQGFQYTFGGGSLESIKNPAETAIGYIPGPGGFAWLYGDGHVVWKTEPPKPPTQRAP